MNLDRRQFSAALVGLVTMRASAANTGVANLKKTFGSPAAPVTIEVFSDFECPSCKNLHEATLPPLKLQYVWPGKVQLIHRDFPLPQHKYSRLAAMYANAAAAIDQFEPVASGLFAKQQYWSSNGKVDEVVAGVLKPAQLKQVRMIMNDSIVPAAIEADLALGRRVPLNQTPTIVISHKQRRTPVAGFIAYDMLRQYLDGLLKG